MTGAASGIGRAVVDRYRREDAKVVAVVRDDGDAAALRADGCEVVVGDVGDYATAAGAVARARDVFGGLDAYVANAGIWDFHKRIEKQTPDQLTAAFDEIFRVNLLGVLFGARAAIGALRETRGCVIATGSSASFRAGGGGALYTSSKFALRGLVMQLATEFAPDVRVNGVAPGATATGLAGASALGQATRRLDADAARMDAMRDHIPMARVAQPEDHTGLYVLLASRTDSAYVTGAMFLSDGGLTLAT